MGVISAFFKRRRQVAKLNSNYSFRIPAPKTIQVPLHFPITDIPLVSIILAFHNHEAYTRQCLASILQYLPKSSFEIILIDDHSTDAIDLSDITGVRLIQNKSKQGFIKSTNQGIQHALGEYIYLLNATSIVQEGFLDELVYIFETQVAVGAVGSMLLDNKSKLQAAGMLFLKDEKHVSIAGVKSYLPEVNYSYEVDYCTADSLLFKKKSDNGLVNLLDAGFSSSYFADADLCFRLKYQQGKRVYYSPFSKVTQYKALANGINQGDGTSKKSFNKSFDIFKQKWQEQLAAIKANTVNHRILEFCDYSPIVFFNDQVPQYDTNSGELRLTEIMKAFKHLNYHVTLVTLANKIDNTYNEYFQRLGVAVLYEHSRSPSIARYFKAMNYANPRVWMHSATTFNRFYEMTKKTFQKFDLIFDMVDIHHLRHKRASELFPDDKNILVEYDRYLKIETEASQLADIVIPISKQERTYMRSLCADEKMLVISNIHYSKIDIADTPTFADREGLLFVGSLHTPNIDAINYLIDDIMPLIWQTDPCIKLHIVGNVAQCFPAERKSLSNVIFHGFVPEISPYYLQHRIIVAPLRYGAGVKGKIGQALEYHVPVVSSEIGTEGMFLIDGKHILIAETAEDFAKKTLSLYSDEKFWNEIQTNAASGLKPFSKEELYKKIKQMELMLS